MYRLMLVLVFLGLICFLSAPSAIAQELTADDYVEFWQPMVGTWMSRGAQNRQSRGA